MFSRRIRRVMTDFCQEHGLKSILNMSCGNAGMALPLGHESGGREFGGSILAFEISSVRAEAVPFADKSFDLAVLYLTLHRASEPLAIIKEASRVANYVLALDYRLPERNLELPATVLAHFRAHFMARLQGRAACFRAFMNRGALQGLAYEVEKKTDLRLEQDLCLACGALGMICFSADTAA